MDILFGWHLDGYQSRRLPNVIGSAILGPQGLLGVLETRLGLSGGWPEHAVRLVQYQHCLGAVDHGERFFSASFRVDALAVAETLLNWRDTWLMGGWDGQALAGAPKRLQDMADIEAVARTTLAAGTAERVLAVLQALQDRSPGIERVALLGSLEDLPYLWRELLNRLPLASGDDMSTQEGSAMEGSDIARLQAALLAKQAVNFRGDGTFFVLKGGSETTVARSLAGAFTEGGHWTRRDTTVIAATRGDVLDQALSALDEPRTGAATRSMWRPAPQVLRLALSLLWEPLDPHRLLEFLTHPLSPIPGDLRARLAAVVAEYPGMGGEAWLEAVKNAKTRAIAAADGDERAADRLERLLGEWLEPTRYHPMDGAPAKVLAERCAQVARWAAKRGGALAADDPERSSLAVAQGEASAAARAIDELASGGATRLTRLQLDRLIDQITTSGSARPDVLAECGHVHRVSDPGAVFETSPRVVWWDFTSPSLPGRWPWTPGEIAALSAQGGQLLSVDSMLQTQARDWLRPVMSATDQLVLVIPQRNGNDAPAAHPLWDQIVALAEEGQVPTLDLGSVIASGTPHPWLSFAMRPLAQRGLPPPKRWWKLPDGARLPARAIESFSSLSDFVNAPHKWVLQYPARLRKGSLTPLLADNRQKGNLLHRLFETLFAGDDGDWRTLDRLALQAWIERRFNELLKREGANLLLPGFGRDAEALRSTAIEAAWSLMTQLRAAGVTSAQMEFPARGRFCGGALAGRIDMLATTDEGKEAVIDLKWGGYDYRCDELRENRQLQLATYAVMRQQEGGHWPSEAFFILDGGRLLAQRNDLFPDAVVCAPNAEYANTNALWEAFQKTWAWRRAQLDDDLIEVNVEGTEPDEASKPPENALAIAGANDRFDDFVSLTGWPREA